MTDTKKITEQLSFFLHRFHVILFVVVILGGLAVLIFFLNIALESATSTDASTIPAPQTSFDEATIERLKQLRPGDSRPEDIKLPSGRINPFIE